LKERLANFVSVGLNSQFSNLKMLRILLIITLILISIPLFDKAKNYADKKIEKAKVVGEAVKDAAKEIPKKIKQQEEKN